MGETFAGAIEIGGKLPRAELTQFVEAAREDGACVDWGDDVMTLQTMLASVAPGEALALTNQGASCGQFRALEAVCREMELTYRRESAPCGEFDGEIVFWHPGTHEPVSTRANAAGKICVTLDELRKHLRGGDSLADVVALLDSRIGAVPAFGLDTGSLSRAENATCRRPRASRGRRAS